MTRDWKNIRNLLARSANKYPYYFGTYTYEEFSKSKIATRIPYAHVGWGKRAVEMRANKTHFDGFENDTLGLNALFEKYRVFEALDKVKEDVLVAGCGFLALAGDRVMPFTAQEATGTFDWREQNLKDGIAVFREDTARRFENVAIPDSYIEFTPEKTVAVEQGNQTVVLNTVNRPLMGLLTHKATTKRPFGRSVLDRPARDAILDASRTGRQAMIAAYHYNVKVDLILGADSNTTVDAIEAQTGDVLKIGTNENGQIPQIGEFAQHAMTPFSDTILIAARNFCSATKLSLANLGISSNAPQSTEALEIVSDDLKDDIMEWQRELGRQLKYFGVTLWMNENNVRELDDNLRQRINETIPVWLSVYREDVSRFGDGLNKIAQDAPAIVEARSIWRNLGLNSSEIDKVIESARNQQNAL